MTNETVKILWTGGWDSTFQLLKLLLIEKKRTEPLYLIDPERKSIRNEFLAMKKLKKKIFSQYPEARDLLLPTKFYSISDFEVDKSIKESSDLYTKQYKLGSQYAWLSSFCKVKKYSNVQLGVEKGSLFELFYRIEKDNEHFKKIFKYFQFPLIDITKQGILDETQKNEWMNIMTHTWFCHKPTKKGSPCGKCNPCDSVIKEGMSWRISKTRLLLRHLSL